MLELEHEFRVLDVHTRLDLDISSDETAAHGSPVDPERVEREMHQAGVVRTVVFSGPLVGETSYLRANNAVARHAVDRPFVAFARINGPHDPGHTSISRLRNLTASRTDAHSSPDDVERYAYDDRFHGFKLNPSRDGLPDADVLRELENVGLPVIVHADADFPPAAVEATLLDRSFPVILAHFGGYPLDRDRMNSVIDLLSAHDECYIDTSVVRFRDILERAMLEHPDRVLFGSGAPDVHPNVAVMEILTLDVSEDAMRKTFSNNPERVIPALGAE